MKINSVLKTCAAAAVLSAAMAATVFAANPVNVTINGNALESDTPAQIVDGRTMVPLRAIFEALGAEIEWSAKDKTVTAEKDGTVIKMTIGAPSFDKNGTEVALDTPAMVIDSRTMVPARAVSESLGCDVKWDAETKTVIISVPETVQTTTQTTTTEPDTETTTQAKVKKDITEEGSIAGDDLVFEDWMLTLAKNAQRPEPALDNIKNDKEKLKKHHIIKSFFMQVTLPSALINVEADCADAIKSRSDFKYLVEYVWLENFLLTSGYYSEDVEDITEEKFEELADKYIDQLYDLGLRFDDNVAVNVTTIDNKTYAAVVAVSEDYSDVSVLFDAILYDKINGFRIYSLVRGGSDEYYAVTSTNGKEILYYPVGIGTDDGDFGDALDSPATFLYIVNDIEEKGIKPTETISIGGKN